MNKDVVDVTAEKNSIPWIEEGWSCDNFTIYFSCKVFEICIWEDCYSVLELIIFYFTVFNSKTWTFDSDCRFKLVSFLTNNVITRSQEAFEHTRHLRVSVDV